MTFDTLFGKPKAIIAMAHFAPMPGQPLHDDNGGIRALVDAVRRDVEILAASGVDAVMFCNEGDRPYRTKVGPEVLAGEWFGHYLAGRELPAEELIGWPAP